MSTDLIKRVLSTITRHAMLRAGERVGLAVSGGSDSVALLRILHEVSGEQGIRLVVLHFNHGLRGADSEGDEQFVTALAAHLGLPFFSGREDVAGVARTKRWNLEDAGRRLRYRFFADLVAEGRIDRVAVAHTSDDQAETVLARILRGTGPSGLAAIYPVNGHVIRPLLDTRRVELREYLRDLNQSWREDVSNYDQSRMRSRLRHQILPILESQIQPAVVAHLSRLAERSREDEAYWKAMTRTLLGSLLEREGSLLRIRCADLLNPYSNGSVLLSNDLPKEARSAVSKRLIREIISELRGHSRQWTADHVERVAQMASSGSSGSRVELPGVIVERCFGWLWFSRAKKKQATEDSEYTVALGGNREVSSSFLRVVTLANPGESTLVAVPEIKRRFHLKVVDWHLLGSDTEAYKLALDKDLLHTPLVLRNWRHGDSFRPKGRRSSRKLKQFFRMKRVAVPDREGWPVLTSGDMLVWARGLPVAADFAARAATRAGVIISEEEI